MIGKQEVTVLARRLARVAIVPLLPVFAAGCTPEYPGVSVTTRLHAPLENRAVEAAVRGVPGVTDVEVRPPSHSYTLTLKQIPDRDTVDFRAPGLAGAHGSVYQSIDPHDFTTTTVVASARWFDGRPNEDEIRTASATLQELMGWLLLSTKPHAEGQTYRNR
jgi:hypothetical protein